MTPRRLLVAATIATFSAAGVVGGCGSAAVHPTPSGGDQVTGTISAALTAVGPNGATYALPSSTSLVLQWENADAGGSDEAGGSSTTSSSTLSLSAQAATQSFSVASGAYTAELVNATSLITVGSDGGTMTVAATLTDPQPYRFTVAAGQTTALVFHFTIEGIGNVTFSNGTLQTSLAVDSGTVAPGHGSLQGVAYTGFETLNGPPTLNSALAFPAGTSSAGVLPDGGPIAFPYAVSMTLTSPFTPGVDSACANITATVTSAASPGYLSNIEAFFEEPSGGTGTLCAYDTNNGQSGDIAVYFTRTGAPLTSQINGALDDDGGASGTFALQFTCLPSSPIYDGGTLALSALSQPAPCSVHSLDATYTNTGTSVAANLVDTFTLQLTP